MSNISDVFNKLMINNSDSYHEYKVVFIDGEGIMLYLTFWKTWLDDLMILWEEYSEKGEPFIKLFKFDFEVAYKQWQELKIKICDDYIEHFLWGSDWENKE